MLDGATNCTLAREFLELLNKKANVPNQEFKISTYFMQNNKKCFAFFCVMRIIKCMRTNLIKKEKLLQMSKPSTIKWTCFRIRSVHSKMGKRIS